MAEEHRSPEQGGLPDGDRLPERGLHRQDQVVLEPEFSRVLPGHMADEREAVTGRDGGCEVVSRPASQGLQPCRGDSGAAPQGAGQQALPDW